MTIKNLAAHIDFGFHRATTTHKDIEFLCKNVIAYQFNSAYVNPYYVPLAKELLHQERRAGTVISFPLGQDTESIKIAAINEVIRMGVNELDIVLNIAHIKEHNWNACFNEMETLVNIIRDFEGEHTIKFIPETGFLTDDEIKKVAELIVKAGADFFKTCSGYGPRGATVEDIKLVREAVGQQIKIKVAGGIHSYERAIILLEAGADRIGTSKAIEIVTKKETVSSGHAE